MHHSETPEASDIQPDIGIVAVDPLLSLQPGAEIHFAETLITFPFDGRAGALADWRVAEGMVLGLAVGDRRQTEIHGSAVLVAPGVALCATHVIETYRQALMRGRADAVCFGVARHGVDLWRVRHVTQAAGTDISVLGLEAISALPVNAIYRRASITTRLPRVGERLLCLGFRASAEAFEIGSDGQLALHGALIAAAGTVQQRFVQGRDRLVLPWPSVEVDLPTWGGMSGGPVFDGTGKLIGLLSKSLETGDEPSPSYVSLLWPMLTTRFRRAWPPISDMPETLSFVEMDRRMCSIDRPEVVSVTDTGAIEYSVWE